MSRKKAVKMATPPAPATPSVILQSLQPAPLPIFRGEEGEDSSVFCDAARRAIHSFNIPQLMAAEWVIASLHGPAREEILSRPADRRTTGEDILAILEEAFKTSYSALDRLRRFHGRRQGTTETVLDYGHSLAALARQANSSQRDAVPAWALRDRFIDGLSSSALRAHLREKLRQVPDCDFLTLRDDARKWARDYPEEATVNPVTVASEQLEQLRLTVAALTARLDKPKTEIPQPQPASEPRQASPQRCFWCDQPGHFEADCPAKRRYFERKRQREVQNRPPPPPRRQYRPSDNYNWRRPGPSATNRRSENY